MDLGVGVGEWREIYNGSERACGEQKAGFERRKKRDSGEDFLPFWYKICFWYAIIIILFFFFPFFPFLFSNSTKEEFHSPGISFYNFN